VLVRRAPAARGVVAALATTLAVATLCSVGAPGARAGSANGWTVRVVAQPSEFSEGDTPECEKIRCDSYMVLATNASEGTLAGPATVSDTLGVGLALASTVGGPAPTIEDLAGGEGLACQTRGATSFSCSDANVTGGDMLVMTVPVVVSGDASSVRDTATVEEGGRVRAQAGASTAVSEVAPAFGIQDFAFEALEAQGLADTQAGGHPYSVTNSFDLTSRLQSPQVANVEAKSVEPIQEAREVAVTLPLGFFGDPRATPMCPLVDLNNASGSRLGSPTCPAASQVGLVTANFEGALESSIDPSNRLTSPIYNMTPERGYPAELGFTVDFQSVLLYASVVRTPAGYGLRIAGKVPRAFKLDGLILTLWGTPGEASHDAQRKQVSASGAEERGVGAGTARRPFLTNPAQCATPVNARIEVDAWTAPGEWVSAEAAPASYPALEECDVLQFAPTFSFAPQSSEPDAPSSYIFRLHVPQAPEDPAAPATPDLKDATVTVPAGVTVSPSAANGLVACQASGPEGINIGSADIGPQDQDLGDPYATELGEGHAGPDGNGSRYDDGTYHIAKGHCPSASQIGSVRIRTPLLGEELVGHVYVAQPRCGGAGQPACSEEAAENGELFGLYLEAEAPNAGVIVKLAGSVEVGGYGPHSLQTGLLPGQLRARFTENPQLPFEALTLTLQGGQRAPLANPQGCGSFTTLAAFEPWSAPFTPTATPSAQLQISGCASPTPFSPSFDAGSTTTGAGAHTDFTLTFSRKDGEGELAGVTVHTPAGLLGEIAGVPRCGEAAANAGTCPASSQIGSASVAAGVGSEPYWLHGRVYLTDGYKGRPFGLSIVTPTTAGPFTLAGNTGRGEEVVRAAIAVNPQTAALTVTSDPLPQSIDGVPIHLQTVNVEINRAGFMLNPTNCEQQQVKATLESAEGALAQVATPFRVTNCATLPFKPSFSASTRAYTSRRDGAALGVKLAQKQGEANIRKVETQLPIQLPSRLPTLTQACTEEQFKKDPANCPGGSFVGYAMAQTPLLAKPLTGPAVLVARGAEFPNLEVILQGEGVTIDLVGRTNIHNGVTYSYFETVPDAPVQSFELHLPEGTHSLLGANGGFCSRPAGKAKVKKAKRLEKRARRLSDKKRARKLRRRARELRKPVPVTMTMPTTIEGQNGAVVRQNTKVAVSGCPKLHAKKTARWGR
jgi:hypothetical protein